MGADHDELNQMQPATETEVIEGGHVANIDEIPFEKERHHAETASRLAIILVCMMGGSVLLHYGLTAASLFYGKADTAQSLALVFDKWLPVISGLVGGAVTYYFTRMEK